MTAPGTRRRNPLWALGCAICVTLAAGCGTLLGIEERTLDQEPLDESGYEGCEPDQGECDACTSEWHECLCEGWSTTVEPELRNECASLAPEAIRDEVQEQAKTAYEEYLAGLPDAGNSDDTSAADDGDDDTTTADDTQGDDDTEADDTSDDDAADDDSDDTATADDTQGDDDTEADDTSDDDAADDDTAGPFSEQSVFTDDFCDAEAQPDACAGCFCDRCAGMIQQCLDDDACAAIMDCALLSGCDPAVPPGDPLDCYQPRYCKTVIDAQGGPRTPSDMLFHNTGMCAVNDGCACFGGDSSTPSCSPASQCGECPDCWSFCFCDGSSVQQCQRYCGDPRCVPGLSCEHCFDCVDRCLCDGEEDPLQCLALCDGPNSGGPDCTVGQGCACDNCVDTCLCEGGTPFACEESCLVTSLDCTEIDECGECATCAGSCGCEEDSFLSCMTSCEVAGCQPDDCAACQDCQATCECEGGTPEQCLQQCHGVTDCSMSFTDECTSCTCELCTTEFSLCEDTPGCPEMMDCMRDVYCTNLVDCSLPELCDEELENLGGIANPRAGIVEALQQCRIDSGCPCLD